ncbi:hypothetical protein D3C79_549080 [compost metagenome]
MFEGDPGLSCISVEFSQAKTQSEQGVAIRMQVVAKLRRESRSIWREHSVSPDDCTRLTTRDETASEAGCRRLRNVSHDGFRCCWHWQLLGRRLRRRRLRVHPREDRHPTVLSVQDRLEEKQLITRPARYRKMRKAGDGRSEAECHASTTRHRLHRRAGIGSTRAGAPK